MTARALGGLAAIPVEEVHPSPNNPRERLTGITELAASIRETGLVQPLIVQKIPGNDGYQVVAGHRRLAAIKALRHKDVACIIRRDMLPDEELLAMLVENGQRASLDPIEEARALRRLVDAGKTEAEVANGVGRAVGWVKGRLMLLRLPAEEQEALRAGHYTLGHANQLIRDERARQRSQLRPTARPVGRPKGAKTKPYFGDQHPLARTARAHCSCKAKPKVAGVACGECWESVIRSDERQSAQQEAS